MRTRDALSAAALVGVVCVSGAVACSAPSEGRTTSAADSSDPFDPASCAGTPITLAQAGSMFAPGATTAALGNYTILARRRACNQISGCAPWQSYSPLPWSLLGIDSGVNVPMAGSAELAISGSSVNLVLSTSSGAPCSVAQGLACSGVGGATVSCSAYEAVGHWGLADYGSGPVVTECPLTTASLGQVDFAPTGVVTQSCSRLDQTSQSADGSEQYEAVILIEYGPPRQTDAGTPPADGGAGGTGTMVDRLSGKCFGATSAASGAPIEALTCDGSAGQQWSVPAVGQAGPLTNVASGLCLDLTGSNSSDGTQIELYTCTGNPNQVWVHQADGSMVNPQSGKCANIWTGSSDEGTPVELYSCQGTANELWDFRAASGDAGAAPSCGSLADGTYCGDDGITNGDASTLYQCSGGSLSVVEDCAYGCYSCGGNDSCN
jgi:hypothetical protein